MARLPSLAMDIAIVGASGDCGRQVATRLIESRLLDRDARLQLVGREGGCSASVLHGLVHDLEDAYDENTPLLDVALQPHDVVADVIVVAAGLTVPPDLDGTVSREDLASANTAVFADLAQAIADTQAGHELVVVVSNPVELGVRVFADVLGRHRVIGMGAFSDTLRFRREIAGSLGLRRQQVSGWVLGEHGDEQVPLWSTVQIHGLDRRATDVAIARLRGARTLEDFPAEIAAGKAAVITALRAGDVAGAFRHVDRLPPDLRTVLRPWATHVSGAKTAVATAAATVELVEAIVEGREMVVAGQVALEGEVLGMRGVVGVPVVLGQQGWTSVVLPEMGADEVAAFARVTDGIQAKLGRWLSGVDGEAPAPRAARAS